MTTRNNEKSWESILLLLGVVSLSTLGMMWLLPLINYPDAPQKPNRYEKTVQRLIDGEAVDMGEVWWLRGGPSESGMILKLTLTELGYERGSELWQYHYRNLLELRSCKVIYDPPPLEGEEGTTSPTATKAAGVLQHTE